VPAPGLPDEAVEDDGSEVCMNVGVGALQCIYAWKMMAVRCV